MFIYYAILLNIKVFIDPSTGKKIVEEFDNQMLLFLRILTDLPVSIYIIPTYEGMIYVILLFHVSHRFWQRAINFKKIFSKLAKISIKVK